MLSAVAELLVISTVFSLYFAVNNNLLYKMRYGTLVSDVNLVPSSVACGLISFRVKSHFVV